jgi:hypothetical protein
MSGVDESKIWKKCSNCKKPLLLGAPYFRCSVSTCNHDRTGLQFCSVSCWSAHVPIYRHRESWAVEETAPKTIDSSVAVAPVAKFIAVTPAGNNASAPASSTALPEEVLVVVSKLKGYVKAKADMNTSADVIDALSDHLRRICDDAIVRARADGRKTVMARDFAGGK